MNSTNVVQISATADIPQVVLDDAGRIAEDVSCRRCGYNLRTLSPDGRCPECGTAVGRSLHGDLLRFSDPNWVQKLASGMNWIVASIIIGFLSGLIGTAVMAAFGTLFEERWHFVALPLFQYAVGLVSLIGYWMITTPDPAKLTEETPVNARNTVRVTQVGQYLLGPMQTLLQQIGYWLFLIPMLVAGLCSIVGTFAVFIYGRSLALRLPDDKLARECRIVMWGLGILVICSLLVGVIMTFFAGPVGVAPATTATAPTATDDASDEKDESSSIIATTAPPTAAMPVGGGPVGTLGFTVTMCFLGLGYLVFGIWALRLILRFRKLLNEAARVAIYTWAREP